MRRTLALLLCFSSLAARAAPNEIKVFTDELAAQGESTLETYVNKPNRGPFRVMPEYSYGIRKNWELSLQLPAAFEAGASRIEGYRAELQYVAPHDEERGPYWGVNFELAREQRWDERRFWNAELVPILGYRAGRWHLVANPGFDKPLRGESGAPAFNPVAKVAYQAAGRNWYGAEYYRDGRILYFAWDGKIGRSDINVGLGRGLTDAPERWVLKAIYEFAF